MGLSEIDAAITTELLCEFKVVFADAQIFDTPLGQRATFVIDHGRFDGPRLTGDFLPGGGDWVTVGNDGVAQLDVRATLRTDDGASIFMTSTGRALLTPEARERHLAGELIAHDEMYARSSPLFCSADERYHWLNAIHTVAILAFSLTEVRYRVFAIN